MGWLEKKDAPNAEVKSIENELRLVEDDKKKRIYDLGESFYAANKDNESLEDEFAKQVDTINKLEYNCKVWNNRKLKTQGLRVCDNCGNILPYDSFFCNRCGDKLEPVAEELVIIQD